jgi:hypothetical protein
MDKAERLDIARRLMAMQASLRAVMEVAELQGQVCDAAGESGLAFAVYMLKESIGAYSKQLNVFVSEYLEELKDGEEG